MTANKVSVSFCLFCEGFLSKHLRATLSSPWKILMNLTLKDIRSNLTQCFQSSEAFSLCEMGAFNLNKYKVHVSKRLINVILELWAKTNNNHFPLESLSQIICFPVKLQCFLLSRVCLK